MYKINIENIYFNNNKTSNEIYTDTSLIYCISLFNLDSVLIRPTKHRDQTIKRRLDDQVDSNRSADYLLNYL